MVRRTWSAFTAFAASNSAAMLGANLASAVMGFASGIVTARTLGPAGRGELAVISFWPAIVALFVDLSLTEAVTLRVAEDRRSAWSGIANGVVIAIAGTLIGGFSGWVLLRVFMRNDQLYLLPIARMYLVAFLPVSLMSAVVLGGLMGSQRFRAVAVVRIASALAYLAAVGWTAWNHSATPANLAFLGVCSNAIPIPIGFAMLAAMKPFRGPTAVTKQAGTGARLQATRVVGTAAGLEDRAIANWTLGPAEIGMYQIPASLTYVMPLIALSFSQVLFSKLAQCGSEERAHEIVRAFARAVALTGVVACVALPMLPFIVPFAYGRGFAAAVVPAGIILVATVIGAGSQILQSAARSAIKVTACIQAEAAAVVTMAIAAVPMTRWWGLIGLALSYLVGRATSLAWMLARTHTALGIRASAFRPTSKEFRAAVASDRHVVEHLFSARRDQGRAA
jgi:O-antigen/teichoic acid export membrane protein